MEKLDYIEIDFQEVSHLLDLNIVLLVTATDLETEFTHHSLKPIYGYSSILKVFEGNYTYYIGMFEHYKIAHVQCSMGAISRGSSIMAVSNALKKIKTNVVIMVGIAFGIDNVKQSIGDVLVSESIIPYDSKRVGQLNTIPRGQEVQASQTLLSRIRSLRSWEFILSDGKQASLIFTRLLSGETLIDNVDLRDELIRLYPESKGGEMEGAGIASACENNVNWILVKGICDFADGNKSLNKKENQETAIKSALSLCSELFSSKTAFKDLGIVPFHDSKKGILNDMSNVSDVLFDYYDESKKQYYLVRENDNSFNQAINQYGIWVYGPSGCGKSNLIIRNIINTGKEFIQVNLAPYIGQDIDSFFKEILYEISSKVNGVHSQVQPTSFTDCIRELISILRKYFNNKELIIFIEEIPISSEEQHKDFAEKLFSLIISKNFQNGLSNVKFVLSSLENPTLNISVVQQKIHQQISFIPMEYWLDSDIIALIEMILGQFKLELSPDIKRELIESAEGSPRFIKKFFRSIYTLNKADEKTLRIVLNETKRDLK